MSSWVGLLNNMNSTAQAARLGDRILNASQQTSGKVLYVDSTYGADSPDFDGESWSTAKASVNAAIDLCSGANYYVINIAEGHAESIANATTLISDTGGIAFIGHGSGDKRPTFTFATATAAAIPQTGADCVWYNCKFVCNIANQVAMFTVAAGDVVWSECEFTEGSATGVSFIAIGTADADSDGCIIDGCTFRAPTAGNYDEAIGINKDMANVTISNCVIYGDFDEAGIEVPAGGNACTNLRLINNHIANLQAGQHAIQIDSTAVTGMCVGNRVQTNAQATAIDPAALSCFDNLWTDTDGSNDEEAIPVFGAIAAADNATNILGADNNNNSFASTNVVANADGSIIERLEYLQGNTLVGETFYTVSSVTSSQIPNNTQTGGAITGAASGALVLEEIMVNTDGTGWATPTNIEFSTDNVAGLTGAGAPIGVEVIGSFGANATVSSKDFTSTALPYYLESGKKLYIHGDDAAGTGGGVGTVICKWKRTSIGGTIAGADLTP